MSKYNTAGPLRVCLKVRGSREWSTLCWSFGLFAGGLFFLLTGLRSYFGQTPLLYIPQGIFLVFYGTLALILSVFLVANIIWNVGYGACTVDKSRNLFRLIRLNFPGSYRLFEMTVPLSKVKGISLQLRSGIVPKRSIGLIIGGASHLPLNSNQELIKIATLETLALALARWLGVGLEWREEISR